MFSWCWVLFQTRPEVCQPVLLSSGLYSLVSVSCWIVDPCWPLEIICDFYSCRWQISMSLISINVLCYIVLYTVSLPSSLDEFKGCQWVQLEKTLLLSTTVTTATQTHLELQENHPKFVWACQRPLLPSKLVRSQFFSAFSRTPPPSNPWFGILIPPPPCFGHTAEAIPVAFFFFFFCINLLSERAVPQYWHYM